MFFLSNYDFENLKVSDLIDYYEKNFDEFKEGDDHRIKNNDLIIYDEIIIKNYKNYNSNYYDFDEIKKMRFMYEKCIKYPLISKNILFYKYKDKYLNFFKLLFLDNNSCIKK
jgi:hypothetical protein